MKRDFSTDSRVCLFFRLNTKETWRQRFPRPFILCCQKPQRPSLSKSCLRYWARSDPTDGLLRLNVKMENKWRWVNEVLCQHHSSLWNSLCSSEQVQGGGKEGDEQQFVLSASRNHRDAARQDRPRVPERGTRLLYRSSVSTCFSWARITAAHTDCGRFMQL